MHEFQMSIPRIAKYFAPVATVVFLALDLALDYGADIREDTAFVFALIPAALCFCLSLKWIRLQTAIVVEFVILGIWLGRQPYSELPDIVPYYFYLAIIGTLAGFKLSELVASWWKRTVERSGGDSPA